MFIAQMVLLCVPLGLVCLLLLVPMVLVNIRLIWMLVGSGTSLSGQHDVVLIALSAVVGGLVGIAGVMSLWRLSLLNWRYGHDRLRHTAKVWWWLLAAAGLVVVLGELAWLFSDRVAGVELGGFVRQVAFTLAFGTPLFISAYPLVQARRQALRQQAE